MLPITSTLAAICALLLLVTSIDTVRQRLRLKVAFGDVGEPALIAASRSHGNLAEYAPIVLIMVGLLENSSAKPQILIGLGAAFVVGRIAHIIGLHQKSEPGQAPFARQLGVMLTWLALVALPLMLLINVLKISL